MWSVSFGGKCTLFTKLKGGLTAASNQTVTQTLHPAGFSQCWYETTRPTLPLLSKYPSCAFVMSHTLSASEGAWDSPSVGLFVTVVQGLEALLFLLLAEAGGVGHFKEGRCELHQPARVDGGHLTHVLLCSQHQLVVHNPVDKEFEKSDSAQLARKIYFLFRCGTVNWNADIPLRLPVEQSTGGVDVNNLLVYQGSVALLRIFFGRIPEETTADGFLDSHSSFTTRYYIQFMSREKRTC